MPLVYRSDLVTKVRRMAGFENSQFVTDDEIASYLDDGARELFDLLQEAHGADYFTQVTTLGTLPAQPQSVLDAGYVKVSLPFDFLFLKGVTYQAGGSGPWLQMRPFARSDVARIGFPKPARGQGYSYRLTQAEPTSTADGVTGSDAQLEIRPAPPEVLALRIAYAPTLTITETYGDPPDAGYEGVSGWELLAVYHAVAVCVAKEDRDPSFWEAKKQGVAERVRRLASERDASFSARLRDTDEEGYGGLGQNEPPWRGVPWR